MANKVEGESALFDTFLLSCSVLFLAAGVVAFYYFAGQPLYFRVGGVVSATLIAAALAFVSAPGRRFGGFVGAARNEVRRVDWPTKQETIQTTLIVFVVVLITGIVLWLLDTLFFWGITRITG